jgi:hypothetical protein
MEQTEAFRAQYRSAEIGPHYNGWLHFAFTSLGCLGVMAFCLWQLDTVSAWEWLTVPAAFLYANLSEWAGHRGPMHNRRPGLGLVFRRHTGQHHAFFTPQRMAFDGSRDYKAVLFPPVLLIFFILAFALPAGLLIAWLLTPNTAYLFVFTSVAYFLNYEWLHFAYHTPENHWASRLPGMRWLRRHHTLHHDHRLMSHANFNITYPIADWLFGTLRREAPDDQPRNSQR